MNTSGSYKYIKKISLRTRDDSIMSDLENFSSRKKLLNNMQNLFVVDGNFADIAIIEQLDSSDSYSKCFVEDLDGVSYVFFLYNQDSSQYGIIEKDGGQVFDLKLLKNNELNYDNYKMCRTGNVTNFKFGRFISDNKSFISVFLANDTCFQLFFETDELINPKPIIDKLNKVDDFSLKSFIDIMEESLENVNLISLKVYKNFEIIGDMDLKVKDYQKIIEKNGN